MEEGRRKGIARARTSEFDSSFFGRVSTGLIHATPGEIKSLRSSAERIALIVADAGGRRSRLGLIEGSAARRGSSERFVD